MTCLITSDTHFTDAPRDANRWELFPWLRRMVADHSAADVLILGDLTDAKDRHSAVLVNRLVSELGALSKVARVWLLVGNHDYVDAATPFFGFSRQLPGVTYVSEPMFTKEIFGAKAPCTFLPSTRDHEEDWKDIDLSTSRWIFCHQTFSGALAENGTELRGIPPSYFDGLPKSCSVVSGDIHTPQTLHRGRITYVGSPYRVHFGDKFEPRVLRINKDGTMSDLHFPGVSREVVTARSVDQIAKLRLPRLSQVKIRLELRRADYPEWPRLRDEATRLAAERGWELCGIELIALDAQTTKKSEPSDEEPAGVRSPDEIVRDFAKAKKLTNEMRDSGLDLVRGAQ